VDQYRRAYTRYLSCVRALSAAVFEGSRPTKKLIESEAAAFQKLGEAREALLRTIDTES
jgi:hypothetical protein